MSDVKCSRFARGFTLIETLIAISILLVAVVGPISLIGDATHKLYYSKDQMIAINLAQEGIEAARQIRDSNALADFLWDTNIASGNYMVNPKYTTPLITPVTDSKVYIDSTTGLYEQGNVTASSTQFTRIVTITDTSGTEKKVTSLVTWKTGGDTGTISASESLFNWQI